MQNFYLLCLAGMSGALVKDILIDGCLELPKIKEGKIALGFIGGAILGAAAGFYIDGSVLTAAMAGMSASMVITGITSKILPQTPEAVETITQLIKRVCLEECVDANLAIKVAKCESSLNPKAVRVNGPESTDRGLFQINTKYHPEVTDEQAFDPEFSTRFFCKAFKAGNLFWWDPSKKCWA